MITINESNLTIMVKDVDRSINFYIAIGLKLKQRWENHYAMLSAAGITIGIHPSDGKALNSGTVSVGFMVNDIAEAKAMLDNNKISCNSEDDGKSGEYLHFKDPDGTLLYFVKPKWG